MKTLTTYVLKGKKYSNPKELHSTYDLAFKAWHETGKPLASDEFTRQDEILILFYKGECAALCFFSHVDMTDLSASLDSYFSCWPKFAKIGLCLHGTDVIICSQFTVIEKFRQEGAPELDHTPWKIILMGMLSKYFLHSKKSAMTGAMRINKGMGRLTSLFGTLPLVEKMEYLDGKDVITVDLVAFHQEGVKKAYHNHSLARKMDQFWDERNKVTGKLKIAG